MALSTNPCGLSFPRTIEIIKDKVLNAGYNGRAEVMKGLLADGFTYSEAREVTDAYFKIYRRVSDDFKKKKPSIILSAQENAQKRLNNIAVDYLNGNLSGFPMTASDTAELEKIYEKAASAQTAHLKEKFNEQAAVFVQKFLPGYSNELFKTFVYANPLLSAVFFVKSFTSNFHAQIENKVANIWDGKKLDFKKFFYGMNDLADASMINVFKGGVPATSLYQSESNVGTSKGRLEEFSIKGTDAADTKPKEFYFGLMKFWSKISNRANAAPDTRGIFSNAERHFYQLSKEHYRDLGKSNEEATQLSLKDAELDDKHTATLAAEAKFNELGLPIKGANGKNTSEFNVAVAEYQRLKRDDVIWGNALRLAKNDFWKRNMTVASELGFGDYGLFGMKAQALSGLRDKMEKHNKTKATSAFNLYAFGFLNGAANFAEDALERMPLYGAIKWGALQSKKGSVTDQKLINDIARRQKDIIVKNVLTATFFVAARMAEHLFCPDKERKVQNDQMASGFTQVGVCGYPVLVPPQMMAMFKVYKMIEKYATSDEEFFDTVLNVLPVLVQSNEIGLGGAIDKLGAGAAGYATAKLQGDDIRANEQLDKNIKSVVRMSADLANSFLPFPSRLSNEAATIVQRSRGMTQRQQDLPFAINDAGKPLEWYKSLGKIAIATMGNVSGIGEIIIAAKGANKNYAVDWQGRKIAQLRGSDIVGSGIQYERADDIIAEAGVRAPYINRYSKVLVNSEKEKTVGFLGKKDIVSKEVRYMTDEEYFNVSVALGNFNKNFFEENGDDIISALKENKKSAAADIEKVFKASKNKAIEAIENGLKNQDEILQYVTRKWNSKRKGQMTETSL